VTRKIDMKRLGVWAAIVLAAQIPSGVSAQQACDEGPS